MPYLDQGEYYAEFGSYDVRITVPQDYIVAATGVLRDSVEKAWVVGHSAVSSQQTSSSQQRSNSQQTSGSQQRGSSKQRVGTKSSTTDNRQPTTDKTLHFIQSSIHDFAWFADKEYTVQHDTILLPSGRQVEAFCYYHPKVAAIWSGAMAYIKTAIRLHGEWIGEYPYDVVSVVEGQQGNPSGMEYPTITFIHDLSDSGEIRSTIFHEIGHNWFQGALANDERRFPWMDEGVNTFYDHRYLAMTPLPRKRYRDRMESLKADLAPIDYKIREAAYLDQPIATPADSMHMLNYDAITYHKTAAWLEDLEHSLGRAAFDKAMQRYFSEWRSRHPYPDDFKAAFTMAGGDKIDTSFKALYQTGALQARDVRKTRLVFGTPMVNNGKFRNILMNIVPGYNLYDGLMAGLSLHNYGLPASRFQYAGAGFYAIGSKKINGIGRLSYSFYPKGAFRKVDIFLSGSHFSMDKYTDSSGKAWYQTFTKFTPGIRLEFRNPDMRSSLYRFLQYKLYSITEDQLFIRRDTVLNTNVVSLGKGSFLLHQITASWEDMRKLYPYRVEMRAEVTKDFARLGLTGRYFFNFRKKGGVDLRVFAGKFIYLGSRTSANQFLTDRFHLNMTGPKGGEDYTYSDYFFGRNAFEGLNNQQIMERDGFFKVRTDLLGNKVGKSDDWLAAANLLVDVPDRLNPLAVLPIKIPVKLFADLGTQAGAWGKYADGQRFLFDGGLAFSLLHSHLRIYVPLVYSSAYGDYFKSTPGNKFFQRISFSLDLREDMIRKIFRQGFE
jgi:hypothetical protein